MVTLQRGEQKILRKFGAIQVDDVLYSGESEVPDLGENKVRDCLVLTAGFFTSQCLTILSETKL